MKIGIINYGAGNIKSVVNALNKLGMLSKIISKPEDFNDCDKIIFPGVGYAKSAMNELKKRNLIDAINKCRKPFLGICLGLQLLADFSEEGNTKCLGVIKGEVKKFAADDLKIPQIGWNKVNFEKSSKLFEGISSGEFFYFVNSYYLDAQEENVLGTTSYGISFSSVIQKENFYAVQFHPEKSGEVGLKLLLNFCTKC